MTKGKVLEIDDLRLAVKSPQGYRPILTGVNLSVARGEIMGLVGESGSGKSMTAKCVLGAWPEGSSVRGSVFVNGEDILGASKRRLAHIRLNDLGLVFQDPRSLVDPLWKVQDYIGAGLRANGVAKDKIRGIALDLLVQVEIRNPERVLDQYPWQLSGGMLQRAVIAGALAGEPELLIADEATTALDVTVQAEIVKLLKRLSDSRDMSVLFITHDLALASEICDRITVMYAGKVMEQQSGTSIFTEPGHPYTQALLRARPRMDQRVEPGLFVVPGTPTSAASAPAGCPFNDRCQFMSEEAGCTTVVPPLEPFGTGKVACLRAEEIRGMKKDA